MSRLHLICVVGFFAACSDRAENVTAALETGDLAIIVGVDASRTPVDVTFGFSDGTSPIRGAVRGEEVVVFRIPHGDLIDPEGSELVLTADEVRAGLTPIDGFGSCGRCVFPSRVAPQTVFPGDACGIPTFAAPSSAESWSAAEIARVRSSVSVQFAGECSCALGPLEINRSAVEPTTLLPSDAPVQISDFAQRADGTLLGVGLGFAELGRPDGARTTSDELPFIAHVGHVFALSDGRFVAQAATGSSGGHPMTRFVVDDALQFRRASVQGTNIGEFRSAIDAPPGAGEDSAFYACGDYRTGLNSRFEVTRCGVTGSDITCDALSPEGFLADQLGVSERCELALTPDGLLLGSFGSVIALADPQQPDRWIWENQEAFQDQGRFNQVFRASDGRMVLCGAREMDGLLVSGFIDRSALDRGELGSVLTSAPFVGRCKGVFALKGETFALVSNEAAVTLQADGSAGPLRTVEELFGFSSVVAAYPFREEWVTVRPSFAKTYLVPSAASGPPVQVLGPSGMLPEIVGALTPTSVGFVGFGPGWVATISSGVRVHVPVSSEIEGRPTVASTAPDGSVLMASWVEADSEVVLHFLDSNLSLTEKRRLMGVREPVRDLAALEGGFVGLVDGRVLWIDLEGERDLEIAWDDPEVEGTEVAPQPCRPDDDWFEWGQTRLFSLSATQNGVWASGCGGALVHFRWLRGKLVGQARWIGLEVEGSDMLRPVLSAISATCPDDFMVAARAEGLIESQTGAAWRVRRDGARLTYQSLPLLAPEPFVPLGDVHPRAFAGAPDNLVMIVRDQVQPVGSTNVLRFGDAIESWATEPGTGAVILGLRYGWLIRLD